MNKFNFLKMTLFAVVMMVGSVAWGQEEAVIYSTGFESSEGFTATTTYNNTTVLFSGPADKQWATYYGTPSTTSPITGAQSIQMRWYTSDPNNRGYTFTNFDLPKATKVTFTAKNTAGINVIVSFSTDGGNTYQGQETFSLSTSKAENTYTISSTGEYDNVRLRFELTYSTAPTATSRLYLDDIVVYGISVPSIDPTITVDPSSLDFERTNLSTTSTSQSVTVTGENLTASPTFSVENTEFTVTGNLTVDGGTLNVAFTPTAVGERTGVLKIEGGGVTKTVDLKGFGVDPTNPYGLDDSAPLTSLNETFEAGSIPATWTNVAVQGDKIWEYKTYQNNSYAQMSANGGSGVYQTLLISPAINFDAISKNNVSFDLLAGYANGASLKVYVMQKDGTKTEVQSITATVPTTGYAPNFTTYSLDLSAYSGVNFLVFEYNGEGPNVKTTTYQVDNVVALPNTPAILVSPETLEFTTMLNETSSSQTVEVTVSNLTVAPIYELTGTDKVHFAVTGTLTAENGGTLSVTFAPTTEGDKSATLTITSGTATATVELTGKVTLPKEPSVVISQIYGGGGNAGATYKNDFIELYNPTSSDIVLTGWSVQYASATGNFTTTNVLPIVGTIKPSSYYLISLASGGEIGNDLPQPDVSGGLNLSATAGKVALANKTTAVSGKNDIAIIDFVGFGTTASDYEGSGRAPAGSNTTAVIRIDNIDTDDNKNDFETGTPNPRNAFFGMVSSATDYFRSAKSGNWEVASTWESSADGSTEWMPATLVPGLESQGVIISNENEVIVTENASTSSLTVNPNGKLTVNEGITFTASSVTLLNDATGSASILGYEGTAQVQQSLAENRWWYITSPITEAASSVLGTTVYKFNAAKATSGYETVTTLTPGIGYAVNNTADITATFEGTLNSGEQNVSINYNGNLTDTFRGYNLIGNPYPSALDWDKVWANTENNAAITATLWYNSNNAFQTYNAKGTIPTEPDFDAQIPPMQGFWVMSKAVSSSSDPVTSTLTLDNTMRLHPTSTPFMLKAPRRVVSAGAGAGNQILRLYVSNGTQRDAAVVYFNGNASDGYDDYDSPKMFNNNNTPEIYTLIESKSLAINGMNTIPYDSEIVLAFKSPQSGRFTISVNEFSNFAEGVKVFLKDKLTGEATDLTLDEYTFESDAAATANRFVLIFPKSGVVTSVEHENASSLQVSVVDNNRIRITGVEAGAQATVYNSVGQLVMSQKLEGSTTLLNQNFRSGIYLVKVMNNGTELTGKVIVR